MSEDAHVSGTDSNSNPFTHQLFESGYCTENCPACEWYNRQKHLKMRENLGYPPATIELTSGDLSLLAAAKISWSGDLRTPK